MSRVWHLRLELMLLINLKCLKYRLKLMIVMSLSVHIVTSQDCMCVLCVTKRFTQRGSLNRHRKCHTGEHVYLCTQFCSRWKSFLTLMHHMNIHADSYKCTECGMCCGSSSHLAVHRRSHSGEKPFEYTVCGKRFTTLVNIVKHSRIHSGEQSSIKN